MGIIDGGMLADIRRSGILLREGVDEFCLIWGRWRFFYTLKGATAPADPADGNRDAIPDYVEEMLCKLELGYALLRDLFGLAEPLKAPVRHIDVVLDDIPTMYGIAYGSVRHDRHPLLERTPHAGASLKVKLHRGLAANTATPMHELFHLYQFGYARIANSWFMEGLATWYHRLFKTYAAKEEPLPRSEAELAGLVVRKHNAESFWTRLFRLCDDSDPAIPEDFRRHGAIPHGEFVGRAFLRRLLAELAKEVAAQPAVDDSAISDALYKELPSNNRLVFRAILRTLDHFEVPRRGELADFAAVLERQCGPDRAGIRQPAVQELLAALRERYGGLIHEQDGWLDSPLFDPLTGTLAVDDLTLSGESGTLLGAVRRLQGSLRIENGRTVDGFDNLEAITGSLTIAENPQLECIGGFAALGEIGGSLTVQRNAGLEAIDGFPRLQAVGKDLRIDASPRLAAITGLGELRRIGGAVVLTNLPALRDIGFLGQLAAAKSLTIRKAGITDGAPLQPLFARNPHFRGSIKIEETAVSDLRFLAPLRSVEGSFYLRKNRIERLDGLERLQQVGASFSLASNRIRNLSPLRTLTNVGGLLTVSVNDLASLSGLESLRRVGTVRWDGTASSLRLYGNPRLRDISALAGVETADRYLVIHVDRSQDIEVVPPAGSAFLRNILQLQDHRSGAILPTWRYVAKPRQDRWHFREAVGNPALRMIVDLERGDAETLVIACAGRDGRLGDPFYGDYPWLADALDCHKMFLTDPHGCWYQRGITGVTSDLEGTLAVLADTAQAGRYKHVLCFGAGMGAHMAILAGLRLQADQVVAFRPNLPPDAGIPENDTLIELHYGADVPPGLEPRPTLRLVRHDCDDRELRQYLRGTGRLAPLLFNRTGLGRHRSGDAAMPGDHRLIAAWKASAASDLATACVQHGVAPAAVAAYIARHHSIIAAQQSLLCGFFRSVDAHLPQLSFPCVTEHTAAKDRHCPAFCERWFADRRKQFFGSFFRLPDRRFLVHVGVGSQNLHVGIVRCRTGEDGGVALQRMTEEEVDAVLRTYGTDLPSGLSLQRRTWGPGWCSIDCGPFDNPESIDTYAAMTDFPHSGLYLDLILPFLDRVRSVT